MASHTTRANSQPTTKQHNKRKHAQITESANTTHTLNKQCDERNCKLATSLPTDSSISFDIDPTVLVPARSIYRNVRFHQVIGMNFGLDTLVKVDVSRLSAPPATPTVLATTHIPLKPHAYGIYRINTNQRDIHTNKKNAETHHTTPATTNTNTTLINNNDSTSTTLANLSSTWKSLVWSCLANAITSSPSYPSLPSIVISDILSFLDDAVLTVGWLLDSYTRTVCEEAEQAQHLQSSSVCESEVVVTDDNGCTFTQSFAQDGKELINMNNWRTCCMSFYCDDLEASHYHQTLNNTTTTHTPISMIDRHQPLLGLARDTPLNSVLCWGLPYVDGAPSTSSTVTVTAQSHTSLSPMMIELTQAVEKVWRRTIIKRLIAAHAREWDVFIIPNGSKILCCETHTLTNG